MNAARAEDRDVVRGREVRAGFVRDAARIRDFNEAVQNPATAFSDADLKNGHTVVGPTGLPLPRSGNFADVYQVRASNGRDWAMKCFTHPVTGLEHRYRKIDDALKKAGLPFTIEFAYLKEGVMVHGGWHPALKMEWVDGLQLKPSRAGTGRQPESAGRPGADVVTPLQETPRGGHRPPRPPARQRALVAGSADDYTATIAESNDRTL